MQMPVFLFRQGSFGAFLTRIERGGGTLEHAALNPAIHKFHKNSKNVKKPIDKSDSNLYN